MNRLWVVMPAYNEEACLPDVVAEWLSGLRGVTTDFTLCVLNDGSNDGTLRILRELASRESEVVVVDKPNTGHGQTCVEGYRMALARGAEWILQVDSDGQCDPSLFRLLANESSRAQAIYGFRRIRHDGYGRHLVSRLVSVCAFAATGVWVRDANVPYRLMHASTLSDVVGRVPRDFHLANILIAVLQQKQYGIRWVDIHFRLRRGGTPSVKALGFASRAIELFTQLRRFR
jgi:dolichol-phosphate mannosyltransferase